MFPCVKEESDGVLLCVYVQPRASANGLVGVVGEELKLRLTSPPVDGAANKLCRTYLAKLLGVAAGKVKIRSGEKSRHKRLFVEGLAAREVHAILADHLCE